jgi:small subunit ribosomal protein S1
MLQIRLDYYWAKLPMLIKIKKTKAKEKTAMSESMKDFEKELEASYKQMEERKQQFGALNEEEKAQWEELENLKNEKSEIDVKVKEVVKSGVVAFVNEVRGFIPASKLSLNYVDNLDEFLGKHIKVRIIELDPESKKLILSAKEILREKEEEKKNQALSDMKPGMVVNGVVESLQPYGAFVRLDNGLSGLVHISQISNKRLKTPSEVLTVGDQVTAKLTQIKDGKLSLSIKALNDVMEESEPLEKIEIPKAEELTTSLASLFKNIKLDN